MLFRTMQNVAVSKLSYPTRILGAMVQVYNVVKSKVFFFRLYCFSVFKHLSLYYDDVA
jgi:hypothetical protein